MECSNLTFQDRDLIVIICFHCEILTKRLFFFAVKAILKVDLAPFSRGNGGKTTCGGDRVGYNYRTICSLGTIKDGGRGTINNRFQFRMC